jgi:hypothetical protein
MCTYKPHSISLEDLARRADQMANKSHRSRSRIASATNSGIDAAKIHKLEGTKLLNKIKFTKTITAKSSLGKYNICTNRIKFWLTR